MSWIRSIQKDWIGKKEEKNRFSVDLPWHVLCCFPLPSVRSNRLGHHVCFHMGPRITK